MAKRKQDKTHAPRIENRRARHDYEILDKLEVGVELVGSEVKSIRQGSVSLAEGFAKVDPRHGNLELHNVDIAPYSHAHGANGHTPRRARRLLAHKREIARLIGQSHDKGVTLIPLSMYFKRGWVKLEIGVARGKKEFDKRQSLKKKESRREIDRAMTRKVL